MTEELTSSTGTELLQQWRERARTNQLAHYICADNYNSRARNWSAASAILSASIGVLILIAARFDVPTWLLLVTSALSFISASIAAITASQKPSEVGAQYHAGGAAYGAINRQIEEALALPPTTEDELRLLLKELREKFDAIPMKVPIIPGSVWPQVPKHLTPDVKKAQPGAPGDAPRAARL